MIHFKSLKLVAFCVIFVVNALCCQQSMANPEFNPQEFLDAASIRSISEVETARLALSKSSSPQVKAYAEHMITDHMAALAELRVLATEEHLQMLDDAGLRGKARVYVFQRKGRSFDTSYADMRVMERKKVVNLFRSAVDSDNTHFHQFAVAALPALMHHLYMAQQLVEQLGDTATQTASL